MSHTFKVQQGCEFRVYPNKANREYFHQCFGCARKMYNLRVEQIQDEQQAYHEYKAQHDGSPAGFKYDWITEKQAKQAYPYLKEVDAYALVSASNDFREAFKRYTQGKANKPRYRSKTAYPRTFRTSNLSKPSGDTIYIHKDPYRILRWRAAVSSLVCPTSFLVGKTSLARERVLVLAKK